MHSRFNNFGIHLPKFKSCPLKSQKMIEKKNKYELIINYLNKIIFINKNIFGCLNKLLYTNTYV